MDRRTQIEILDVLDQIDDGLGDAIESYNHDVNKHRNAGEMAKGFLLTLRDLGRIAGTIVRNTEATE